MAGAMRDEVDDHSGVDEMIVDEEIDVFLDLWKLHVREIVRDHQ
jgi:hypothetical protein